MNLEAGQLFQALFDSSADGLLVSDSHGVVVNCNPALAKLAGWSASEIIGNNLTEYIDFREGEESAVTRYEEALGIKQSSKELEPGQTRNVTVFLRSGLDVSVPAINIALNNASGEPAGFLTIIYIIQASSVQQAQTEFVSTVSHELRTPLTSIKGFADTILRAGDRLDASQQRRYIGIIKDQADRLTRLVEDLLAVSRLESRKMQLTIRAINFEETVQRVCQNLTDKAVGRQLSIKIPPGLPPVWADADRLEQILTNLIDNAIKYSPAKTTVTISARAIDREPEMVEFSVTDQGGGIASEHLPQIFNKFSRLDSPLTRQTEGTGLGLYITKSLVVALDGDIEVTSSPGSTTFTVQIPAATLEQQAARGRGIS